MYAEILKRKFDSKKSPTITPNSKDYKLRSVQTSDGSTSSASNNHSKDESLYGHFSKIDCKKNPNLNDYVNYPNLKKTHPQHFEIKEGEALLIPKKWWHYVRTYDSCYFANFWTHVDIGEKPKIIKHNIKFDEYSIEPEAKISVWAYNEKNSGMIEKTFQQFIEDDKEEEYLWTLKNYKGLNRNEELKENLIKKIKVPETILKTNENFEYNFGVCPKYHQTPLHYDEEWGLLCVTKGSKKAILFPPSDYKYLYPIEWERHKWKNSKNIKCIYNYYRKEDVILSGKNSGSLLYKTCEKNNLILYSISKIISDWHGSDYENKTIYGVKNINGKYSWELYNYTPKDKNINNKIIDSVEILPIRQKNGSNIESITDSYYWDKVQDENVYGTVKRSNSIYTEKSTQLQERGYFIIDTFNNFIADFDKYYEHLKYSKEIYDWVRYELINKYKADYLCIFQKNNNEFYFMFIGISREDFLKFLKEYKYDEDLIREYENNEYNISNEISIIFCKKTLKVLRTAFYGII